MQASALIAERGRSSQRLELGVLDRQQEKAALDRLLCSIREGFSGALVLRGDSGIGKTTLLDYAVASAADMRIARVVGIESEMELGFAALHQLVLPLMPALDRLPEPQRDALARAFGLVAGTAPGGFLVGLATLTLLANAASEQPLLCVIDDAQWLDQASAAVLSFVARRLFADRLGMLFAVCEPAEPHVSFDGLTELTLAGLPDREAREVLSRASGVPVSPLVAERITAQTEGNPLALLELAGVLTPDELSGASHLPDPLPVGHRLEEWVLRRVRTLPGELQTILLLAAAEPSREPALLWRACEEIGLGAAARDLPGADRLLKLAPHVEFRHPVIRSAVYHGASIRARRRAHMALATASDPEDDADRRAWHLAAASAGPDDVVAAELERTADRARDRGGWPAAAASLRRAAALTFDEESRAVRCLNAARAELIAGAPAVARELVEQAAPSLRDPRQRAEAIRLGAWVRFQLGERAAIPTVLLGAARAIKPFDPGRARRVLLEAWEAALYVGETPGQAGVRAIARAARETPRPAHQSVSPGDLLLDGFAMLDTDYPAGVDLLRQATAALAEDDADDDPGLISLGCLAAFATWDEQAMHVLCTRAVNGARARGALSVLLTRLGYQALSHQVRGQLGAAEATLAEGRGISAAIGNVGGFDCAGALELASLARRGHAGQAREMAAATMQEAQKRGQAGTVAFARAALAVLELSLGDPGAALDQSQPLYENDPFLHGTLILPDLIEAAVQCGKRAIASAALTRLSTRAEATGTELALGLLARSRALLASDSDAERLYRAAIGHLKRGHAAGELARAHLLYGEWLRARRRRRDARDQLRTAHEMFSAIGADAFAARARTGLLATGERAKAKPTSGREALTGHEGKIALLAAQGASNPEIASELFISSSTVAYHLRKVFVKLGITSRAQLAHALSDHGGSQVALRPVA